MNKLLPFFIFIAGVANTVGATLPRSVNSTFQYTDIENFDTGCEFTSVQLFDISGCLLHRITFGKGHGEINFSPCESDNNLTGISEGITVQKILKE